ncbi:MAG: ATP-binding protein [Coriobacteriia bacterium]|nr:ATP-binding protein [Coriobacteriia bacterium]
MKFKAQKNELPEELADAGGQGSQWSTKPINNDNVISYGSRMSASFALIAAMTALILVAVLAIVWDNEFEQYTRANMKIMANTVASRVAERYEMYGYWAPQVLDPALNTSNVSEDIGIQVLDGNNKAVYDDTWIISDGKPLSPDLSLAPVGSSVESAPIVIGSGVKVGVVNIWAFGSESFFTQNDIEFRNSSWKAILIAALVAIGLALIVGFLFARSLTIPIKKITIAAEHIKDGDLTARTYLRGNDEVSHLGQIFDSMARSLEKDKEIERRLTTDVAHELRTPLMAIQSTVEAIQDGVLPADEERLAVIGGETRRLSRLVDALLQLSRLENKDSKFNFVRYDLIDLVNSIVIAHEAMARENGLSLEFINKTQKSSLMVEIDPDKIRQAIVNLLSNALRYTDLGGVITLSVGESRRSVSISVSDTGIGIEKSQLDSVFGRFWRAESSRDRAAGGLGVGLAVTKEVVERHHGTIRVESELGVGTSFTVIIPRVQPNKREVETTGQMQKLEMEAAITEPDIREAARKKERERTQASKDFLLTGDEEKTEQHTHNDDELIG